MQHFKEKNERHLLETLKGKRGTEIYPEKRDIHLLLAAPHPKKDKQIKQCAQGHVVPNYITRSKVLKNCEMN